VVEIGRFGRVGVGGRHEKSEFMVGLAKFAVPQYFLNDHLAVKVFNRKPKNVLQLHTTLPSTTPNPTLKGLMVVDLTVGDIARVEVIEVVVMQSDLLAE
jgi:hypothetical protein